MLLSSALDYAARGWPIFPCAPKAKTPITPNGFKDATTNPEIIKGWWQRNPSANIGIATGSASGLVVLDVDVKNGQPGLGSLEVLQRECGTLITRSAKSPSGGWHFYFQHPGSEVKSCAGIMRGLDIRGDGGYIIAPPSVTDTGAYQWSIEEDAAPLPEGLLKRLNGKPNGNAKASSFDRESILNGVPEGKRDDALFRYACSLKRRKTPRQETEVLVREVAANCTPPFPEDAALEKVARAYNNPEYDGPADEPQQRKEYPFIMFSDVAPRLDTTALIQGIIKPDSFIVIYGESGSGKTFDALHRDLCIASGNDYFGRYADKGLVVYLAAEGGDSTRNRVYAYRRELFPSASFVLVPYSMDLLKPGGDVDGVINLVRELESLTGEKCIKVTQDTLARAMAGGNENSSEDMGALVANADRIRHALGCCFEFVHHAGKDAARGARGHSSLRAATDTEIEISACNGVHVVRPTKQRDFTLGDEFAFTLRQVEIGMDARGEVITTCVPVPVDSHEAAGRKHRPTTQERFAIDVLQEAFRGHQQIPPREIIKEPSYRLNIGKNVCPLPAWRQLYVARKGGDGTSADTSERTFRRNKDSLQAKGIIRVFNDWVWFLD